MAGGERSRSKTPVRGGKVAEWLETKAGLTGSALESASEILNDEGVTSVSALKRLHAQSALEAYFSDEKSIASKIANALGGKSSSSSGAIAWPQIAMAVGLVLILLFAGGMLNTGGAGPSAAMTEPSPGSPADPSALANLKEQHASELKLKDEEHAKELLALKSLNARDSANEQTAEDTQDEVAAALKAQAKEHEAAMKEKDAAHVKELAQALDSSNSDDATAATKAALQTEHASELQKIENEHAQALAEAQNSNECEASSSAADSSGQGVAHGAFFAALDKDGDGFLGKDEVPAGFIAKAEAADGDDGNNDGKIDQSEFGQLLQSWGDQYHHKCHAEFDKDGDGKLSEDEVPAGLIALAEAACTSSLAFLWKILQRI